MFLSHSAWLCIILPTLIAATPQKTAPALSKRSLPPKLQQQVPACAQPCLRTSLSEQFPFACITPVDLNCLCSRYSFNGQALGEVAVGCIYASCSTYNGATSAYNVCLGEKYAVSPTLTALTVVEKTSSSPTSLSTSMTSAHPVTITTHRTDPITTTTTSRPTRTSHTETVIADSVSVVPSPTSTTSKETTTSLAVAEPPKAMTPAQIAGLAVAVGAAFVIAIGLMGLTIFLRRRREQKHDVQMDEKGGLSPSPSDYSPRYSQRFAPDLFLPRPTSRTSLPLPPPPVQRRSPSPNISSGENSSLKPLKLVAAQLDASSLKNTSSVHPLLRSQDNGNNTSSSSVPIEQIGIAITAEQPRSSTDRNEPKYQIPVKAIQQQRPNITRRNADLSERPDSVMTQTTLFEEDGVRRESKLLPALPHVPVPPIRTFQPSRSQPANSPPKVVMGRSPRRQLVQQPELFLDIPLLSSRPQPSKVDTSDAPPQTAAPVIKVQHVPRARLSEHNPMSAESDISHGGDIPDYYFTAYQEPRPIHSVTSSNPNRRFRTKPEQSYNTTKPKRSSSNVSRATSRASTNIRDSFSSQTSFETVDPDDPTPEDDEGDRRLMAGKLSPVVESPIHKLRYPKVPRTSNQLVPRSPKSPQSQSSQSSPHWQPQPSSLLVKRKGEHGAFTLSNQFRTGSPDPRAASEIRRYRQHLRSSSVETFSPMRNSERSTRTQSSLWPKSPAMFDEPPAVRPLTIRKTQLLQTPTEDIQALSSPVWVPRLTPTRQGDDLFINVTYSKPGT